MDKETILIVDDDPDILTVVGHYLEDDGYKIMQAASGAATLTILTEKTPDVVLLDLGLPDIDGLNLIDKIRQIKDMPIIVVSGKDDTTDRVVGLEMGADDYVVKPFHLRELSARIKSVMRRVHREEDAQGSEPDMAAPQPAEAPPDKITFEGWMMDSGKFEITDPAGKVIDLTAGEFHLLRALAQASGRVLSREQLFELTRSDDYDSFDRAIDIQIGRLRKKLGDDPKAPRFIKTIRGIGYMFIADVKKTG